MSSRLGPIALCLALSAGIALSAELEGVSMPDQVTVDGKQLLLNGMGLREATFLKVDVYVAGLYLETRSSDPQEILDSAQAKRIVMHFVYKKVEQKKIAKGWTEGLEANTGERFARYRAPLERLNGWMEDMVAGDTMMFTAVPGKGLEVVVKDQAKGTIDDEEFAREFWAIWLGANPPNAGLKTGLLGTK
jgi:hypothetical protein